jgi:hypothetical protein
MHSKIRHLLSVLTNILRQKIVVTLNVFLPYLKMAEVIEPKIVSLIIMLILCQYYVRTLTFVYISFLIMTNNIFEI